MEPVDAYRASRHFQVWLYTVSHGQLLLRSVKSADHATRIDLLFKAVEFVEIPTSFDGLQVERVEREYRLSGDGWRGRIVAGSCFAAEDDGDYFDPSPFEKSLP